MAVFRRGITYLQAHLLNLICALALASLASLASLALTPSLVPRPTLFQGFLAGLWFMVGFQIGYALRGLWRLTARRVRRTPPQPESEHPHAPRRSTPWVPPVIALALLAYVTQLGLVPVHPGPRDGVQRSALRRGTCALAGTARRAAAEAGRLWTEPRGTRHAGQLRESR